MKRVSVTIPDELGRAVRRKIPGVNVSALLQEALREALGGCGHRRLVCALCGEPLDAGQVGVLIAEAFYRDLLNAFEELMHNGGSIEGAARVAKSIGLHHQIPLAAHRPLPRLTRAAREAARDAARDRHPSNPPEETHVADPPLVRSAVA